ncbi:uncharacterized protein LOC118076178 [Zootoca vivipara]|uniref:uncharacterized protein LOC118076178 n=1 Tax=Zootoca vivipara TaxID=8524 RepID=UPI00293C040B|nr:uncharacterized protein LOC118076178 [Zootoca vivipara]
MAVLVREAAGGEGNGGTRRGGGVSRALLLLLCLLSCPSRQADVSGSTHCPSDNFSIAEGSAGMIFANVSSYSCIHYLCHENNCSNTDDAILAITEGELRVYKSSFKEGFYLQGNDLFIKNASKQLAGKYKLKDRDSKICFQVFLSILDPRHSPSANLSIPEVSSGTIIPNTLNHSNSPALYKKNHSSSVGQGVDTYGKHVHISDSSPSIKNANLYLIMFSACVLYLLYFQ